MMFFESDAKLIETLRRMDDLMTGLSYTMPKITFPPIDDIDDKSLSREEIEEIKWVVQTGADDEQAAALAYPYLVSLTKASTCFFCALPCLFRCATGPGDSIPCCRPCSSEHIPSFAANG